MLTQLVTYTLIVLFSLYSASFVMAESSAEQKEHEALRVFLKKTINSTESFKDKYDAEVWLVAMSSKLERYVKDPEERMHILKAVHRESTRANLKPDLVLALIQVESAFDRFAVSSVGARGLMQIMPFWMKEIGRPDDNLMDIDTNIRYGCTILRFYMNREKNNWSPALARYNGSLGKTWYPERVMNAWQRRWYSGKL